MVELQMCCEADTVHELRSIQHHSKRTTQYTSHTVNELRSTQHHHTQYTNCAVHSITWHELRSRPTQHQTRDVQGELNKISPYTVRGTDDTHIVVVTQWRPCRWLIVGLSLRRPGINQMPVQERRVSLPVLPLSVSAHLCSILICLSNSDVIQFSATDSVVNTHTHTRYRAVWLVVINFSEPLCTRLYGFNPPIFVRPPQKLNSEINKIN
jgi:hypothetical protein